MAATISHVTDEHFDNVVARAADEGFHLVQFETLDGQLLWEWRRGTDPRPQFVSRRVALTYMDELLRRVHRSAGNQIGPTDRQRHAPRHRAERSTASRRISSGIDVAPPSG